MLGLGKMSEKLTYDWGKDLQMSHAFEIPDSEPNSLTDQQLAEERYKQFENQFLVPEPPSLSGIVASTASFKIPPPRTLSDVEENYVMDDMSSLTNDSQIRVSNTPKKHDFAKERREREGNTYDKLYNSSLKGQLTTVKEILDNHNATLEPDENGQTSLYAACIGNHLDIVSLLIDAGYDVNHKDNEGKTPLHIAFENHAPELAQTLITQFKANTEIRDYQNWTPLHTAIDRGYFRFSKELSEKFLHQDVGTEISWIQLQAVCFQENTQDVRFLLDANTDVNHISSAVHTALHIAVNKSNIDLVTLLLDQNVNVNSVTIDGKTALHIAVDKSEDAIIHKLLAQKADPSLTDVLGNTSLHLAVYLTQERKPWTAIARASYVSPSLAPYRACSAQTVRAVIDHGGDVNAVNNRGQTALWFACADGHESIVKILLDAGADPNITDKYGDSCLHAAIHGLCSTKVIQEIHDHGAQVNAVNNDGATPLLLACSTAQEEAVKLLLRAKADPNIAYADGDTSLHASIAADCNKETILELIDYGADLNAINTRGRTALLLGCFYRHLDSVTVLLRAGADPIIADEEGFSCLHAAVDGYCSKDNLRALIDHGALIDATRKDGTNALLRACKTGQSESVRFLLDAGADVNNVKPDGNSCLHEAVHGRCSNETLREIIHQGVNVNDVNNKSQTALIVACVTAQPESVKLLLENGANPNITDAYDYTSLHAAVYGCCTNDTLQDIIDCAVRINAQNNNGETALKLACLYQQQDSVRALLEAGSSLNIADDKGNTCLHSVVMGCCSKKIIRKIIDHGADVNATNKEHHTALLIACVNENEHAIKVLLNAGANPNIADDDDGDTCLHKAVRQGCNIEVVQAITDHGADLNATNTKRRTALLIACANKNEHTINVLLNAGADPNIADNADGDTCLHMAVSQKCSKEVLQAIIDHGGDVNATNKEHRTALSKACVKKNEHAINVLLNACADPNIADDADSDTCLHITVRQKCSKEVLQAIIDHGADVNAVNKGHRTALLIACVNKNEHAVNVLLNAGASPNIAKKYNVTPLMRACQNRNIVCIYALLNAGADPNIVDELDETCLSYAVDLGISRGSLTTYINNHTESHVTNSTEQTALTLICLKETLYTVSVLLNSLTDSNIPDAECDTLSQTPLYSLISNELLKSVTDVSAILRVVTDESTAVELFSWNTEQREALNVLLRAGADTSIVNVFGDTCLHKILYKEYISLEYDHETLQLLVDYGVPVNATNKSHQTAYMLACHQGNLDAMCALLKAGADPGITSDDGRDTNLHTDTGNVTVQTIIQWMSPAGHFLDLPELEITESLSFNLVARIICNMVCETCHL